MIYTQKGNSMRDNSRVEMMKPETAMEMNAQEAANQHACDLECRQSLRDSIKSQIVRARTEFERGEKLHKLAAIFDKNPELMEAFELMRDLGL